MNRSSARRILLLSAILVGPSCGGNGGGGGGAGALPVFSYPTAFVSTPVGVQRSIVPIDFTVTDAESDPISITIQFSTDGGAVFNTATPAYGNGSLTGLASTPGGTIHTFLWDSVADGVATGTMNGSLAIQTVGTVNMQVEIRITPSDAALGTAGRTANFTVDNTYERTLGIATASFPHTLAAMGNSETALGDLVADAMRVRYGVQLAFQNGWGIRAPLPSSFLPANTSLRRPAGGYAAGPPYDLVLGDVYLMLPFGNHVVTRTVTGAQLWAVLEQGVSAYPANNNGFPQISGFSFSFKASNPVGSRVLSVTLAGGGAIAKNTSTYTFATNDYINTGGDSYAMLNDGQGVTREILAQVVADYIQAAGTITPMIAGRLTIVP